MSNPPLWNWESTPTVSLVSPSGELGPVSTIGSEAGPLYFVYFIFKWSRLNSYGSRRHLTQRLDVDERPRVAPFPTFVTIITTRESRFREQALTV